MKTIPIAAAAGLMMICTFIVSVPVLAAGGAEAVTNANGALSSGHADGSLSMTDSAPMTVHVAAAKPKDDAGKGSGETSDSEELRKKRLQFSKRLLSEAWEQYTIGNFARAEDLFLLAAREDRFSEIRNEAILGLSYTYRKTGRPSEAEVLLKDLVEMRFRLEDTIPVLADILIEKGQWDAARDLANGLPPDLKAQWLEKIDESEYRERVDDARRSVESAWRSFKAGDYAQAEALFDKASEAADEEVQNEGRLGLAYTFLKTGKDLEARSVFEDLVKEGFKLEETFPRLMELLIAQKDWDTAEKYLGYAPEAERADWVKRLDGLEEKDRNEEASRTIEKAWQEYNAGRYGDAEKHFQAAAESASDPDVKSRAELGTAYTLRQTGRNQEAREVLEALSDKGYDPEKTIPALMDLLISSGDLSAAKSLLSSVPEGSKARYEAEVRNLQIDLMKKELQSLKPGSAEHRRTAERVLSLFPEENSVRGALAWGCLDAEDLACANEQFSKLHEALPESEEYLLGLGYTLEKQGRREDAVELIKARQQPLGPKVVELKLRLYRKLGLAAYEREDYAAAEQYLSEALKIAPDDKDTLELLAWSLYKQDKTEKAMELFEKLYEKDKTSRRAHDLFLAYGGAGRTDTAWDFAESLKNSGEPELQKAAGDWHFASQRPIRAAQAYDGTDSCYVGCDTPWAEFFPNYRFIEGEPGLSQFKTASLPMRMHYPASKGREWIFGVNTMHMDAGSAPESPFAGSYYRRVNDPSAEIDELIESRAVVEPMIGYRVEGETQYEFRAGVTPIGGPVAPVPTFSLRASRGHKWRIQVQQCSVKESLQSYIGQRDPYSKRTWGRVMKTGIHGERSFGLTGPYWFSAGFGYDYLWGEDTVDNHLVSANLSIGRTDPVWLGELSTGLFFSARHFDQNTDFHTFGHGGYFSPQLFFIAGPFIRYESSLCRDYWIDTHFSIGYMYYRSDAAPRYPIKQDDIAGLSPEARDESSGYFEGKDDRGIGVDFQVQVLKFINRFMAAGFLFGVNTSSDYTEWQGGLFLNVYFEPRKTVCSVTNTIGRFDSCY